MGKLSRGKIVDQAIANDRKGRKETEKLRVYRFSAEQHLFYLRHITELCKTIRSLVELPQLKDLEAEHVNSIIVRDAIATVVRIDKEAGEYEGKPGR